MNPFLLGLIGESLGPLAEAAGEIKGAFKAVGGDIAQMRAVRKTAQGAGKVSRLPSRLARRARNFFSPTKKSRSRKSPRVFSKLANLAFASKEFIPRRMRKRMRHPLEGWQKTGLGQAAIETKNAFAAVGGDLAKTKIGKQITRTLKKSRKPIQRAVSRTSKRINRFFQTPPPTRRRGLASAVAEFSGSSSALAVAPSERGESGGGGMNYGRMMADMANPNAYQNEAKRSQKEGDDQEKADKIARAKKEREDAEKKVIKGLLAFGGVLGSVTGAVVGFLPAMNKFTEAITESNRELAPFSGEIASSFARLDIAAFFNQLKTAKGTAGSSGGLNDAVIAFRDVMQPLNQDFRTLSNFLSTWVVKIATDWAKGVAIIEKWSGLDKWLADIEKNTRKNRGQDPAGELLKVLKSGDWATPRARPLGPMK